MTDNLNTLAASKPTNTNQASSTQTTDIKPDMDKINAMILKTAIEAIPLLTQDNYSMWNSRMMNFFELQKIKDTFIKEDKENLTGDDELQARTILISKLDPSIQSNVINHENNSNVILIWKSIVHHFASTQAANRARVWNHFSSLPFDNSDVASFITKIKSSIEKMHEVGINIDTDVIGYEILKKLPKTTELNGLSTAITHSGLDMTPELVLDHLRVYDNNQKINKSSQSENVPAQVALFTDVSGKCKRGAHNTLAAHPKSKCWMLYPHLRPQREPRTSDNRSEANNRNEANP
ncbi:hypothetical protein PGTUg99_050209 [Puccinia graminis f. sp. tritici]|uniref:DUF4219 domain-containing protein n=1 Tax=Puccinia graminis f. sp. tritici TaxID=56615 RepID=A0A5B0RE87_PUCGR|nr:hypothetical protein PGTUg99_050209 [Puccinia graminis f. sp. tritici]